MDKSPDAFRTISEVADYLETPAHVLRFWESRFPQVRPVKRAGGRRYYRPSDVALLAGIRHLLHDEGMTIRGVQKVLREQGVRHVAALWTGDEGAEQADAVAEVGHAEAVDAGPADPAGDADAPPDADETPIPEAEADPLPEPDEVAAASPPRPPEVVAPTAPPGPPPALPPDDLPLFAGNLPRPAVAPSDSDAPTLAARLRGLPPGALAPRADAVAPMRAALADLAARLADRARGARR